MHRMVFLGPTSKWMTLRIDNWKCKFLIRLLYFAWMLSICWCGWGRCSFFHHKYAIFP
uniref:Uncharacterized protein n=1 Tax=Rhizophora mucronata TaxID=61149 RepID=A0A2P2QV73_RHIMU